MPDVDAVLAKAQAVKAAEAKLAEMRNPAEGFCATPNGVYWGRPLGNLPGFMQDRVWGGNRIFFYCEDPQAVADVLNAALDEALKAERAGALAAAQANYNAAVADLATVTK
jgi:hypothetical protein